MPAIRHVERAVTRRERLIETAVRGAVPLLQGWAHSDGKLGRGVRARRGAADRLIEWQRAHRDPVRPIVWFHAPSVGEALMAKAIIRSLRVRRPDAHVVFTCFSPSAERIADTVGADIAEYLPWDVAAHVGRAVAALRPSVVACVRTEVWPLLARATTEAAGTVALVNAVMSPTSGRLRPFARWMLAPTYARLDAVGVVSDRDEPLFQRMGVIPERIRLTGDARFDQVWQRVEGLRADHERLARMRSQIPEDRPVIVAGSTWASDERRLLGAARGMTDRERRPLWIVAPHEPTKPHLAALEERTRAAGLDATRLAAAESGGRVADVLIVDRVGVLADLYAIADVAYVGGGFHEQGLHSVVEPAALGVPVLFGPRHGNAREAADLVSARGGFEVDGEAAIAATITSLLDQPAARASAAAAARRFVEQRLGGADRNAALVADLIETPRRRQGIEAS